MLRHPLLKLIVGLSVGFLGAFTTITTIDWLEDGGTRSASLERPVGSPDFGAYCRDRGLSVAQVGDSLDRWRCVGRLNGLWTHVPLSADDVCRAQYASAEARVTDGDPTQWTCIALP